MSLPTDAKGRKEYPLATGFLDYFPDAIAEVAHLSFVANEQHNPGTPVHWDRDKSKDEADALMRHFIKRGSRDTDGQRHSTKVAWRALALLQKEIEAEASMPAFFSDQLPTFSPGLHHTRTPAECGSLPRSLAPRSGDK
jgi:hypothetical protein